MKKLLFLIIAFPMLCFAQGANYRSTVTNTQGQAIAGATITVCAYSSGSYSSGVYTGAIPCTPALTIYYDPVLASSITQPLLSDGQGNFNFYIASGNYTVTINAPGRIQPVGFAVTLPCAPSSGSSGCSSGGGGGTTLVPTNNIRYVSGINPSLSTGNGSNGNTGLSEGQGLGDIYTAAASLVNANFGGGGTIYATTNGGISGPIYPAPVGLFPQAPTLQGWFGIVGPNDTNLVMTTGSSRAGGTVTVTTASVVPVVGTPTFSSYWQTGNYISAFACQDRSFNGSVFQITIASGSTITYQQSGSTTSTTGCVYVPLGWIPQIGQAPFHLICHGDSTFQSTGGTGSTCFVNESQAPKSVALTHISQSGNIVTLTPTSTAQFIPGIPVRIGYTPLSGSYTYDQFAIVNTVSGSTFTVINPTSSLTTCTSACGYAVQIVPGAWIAGAEGITVDGFTFTQPIALLEGVNSDGNPSVGIVNNGSGIGFNRFVNTTFATPPNPYWDFLFGPAGWAGSNNVWGGQFLNDVFQANGLAPVNTDYRSAFLHQPVYNATAGLASGLFDFEDTSLLGGGGFRFYGGSGSGGAYIHQFLQEGVGQSQPAFAHITVDSMTFEITNAATSDSGSLPPIIYNASGNMPSGMHVCVVNTQTGGNPFQGPMTLCPSAMASGSSLPGGAYTGTTPLVSPAAQGQQGAGQGQLINQDTSAARRLFGPTLQRFTNLAQGIPAGWNISEGSATVTSATGPDGLVGSATKLVCNTPDAILLYCAAQIYTGSQTYIIGDFAVADAYIAAADHSAGHYGGNEFGLNCCTNFPYTAFGLGASYKSNQGSVGYNSQVGGATADDGRWQHEYFWLQSATSAGAETQSLEVRFDVIHPLLVYNTVHYYKISGSQVATPSAPTLGSSASGALAQTNYYVRTTYTNATGETNVQATDTILNVAASHVLTVTCPGASTGATGCNVYVGNDATCAQSSRATVVTGDLTGPGQTCEVKQNATPIAVNGTFTESTSGLVAYSGGYQGTHGPAGQMEPTTDTTNTIGQSEVADIAGSIPFSPPPITVAHLPAASANNVGSILTVSDGTGSTDCVTGGGSTTVVCVSNGSAWAAF